MRSILLSELLLSACPIESAFVLIAANDTRRCTSCFTWFIDLDTPKMASHYLKDLYFFQCCSRSRSRSLARDTCPQCRQERTDLALAPEQRVPAAHQRLHHREQHAETLTATPYSRTSLSPEQRRYMAWRDVKLYQALRDAGSKLPALPAAKCRHFQGIDSLLDRKQERLLFLALQERGAFRYPGMRENMRDQEGRALPDEKIFEVIRQRDCRWNLERGWIKDGYRICFEMPPALDERETCDATGVKGRRWAKRVRVSGRLLPKRMDRADFKLETIVEEDEGLDGSVGWPLPN